ncbi:MAG: GNAT family N-acetyltransferase [Deltaproteobacteria bacterium]|nr:GNAT family N-acetyltransferase [Deltaproteobacteria bacterium]
MILRTERLQLRPWTAADLDDARRLWGDPTVMALLGGPLSPERIEERLARELASQAEHGLQYWRVQDGDAFVGCCGLKRTDDPDFGAVTELGFQLLPARFRRGYATEAARGVVAYAFERLGVPALYAGHHPENDASRGVLHKLGFVQVGERHYAPTGLMHPWYRLQGGAA